MIISIVYTTNYLKLFKDKDGVCPNYSSKPIKYYINIINIFSTAHLKKHIFNTKKNLRKCDIGQ